MTDTQTLEQTAMRYRVRVFYEDTDASGVVYHANYLKYLERARTLWLEAQGHSHRSLADSHGIAFTLADAKLQFKQPARLDDDIEVLTTVAEQRRARIIFEQTIRREKTVLIQARFTVACVRIHDFRPCALPELLQKEMQ
ncbi:tol-pal system-associated acyl-CoA thioesterase [uncultured Salinisphaera sp.]|uniref:tol-pal system-associated acyl-CoA thioesterase n=1 Tax=uncultured Salinisphaera sp. TaxID=359372 RepID=UPI0032B1989E|tara:strand:- start:690 stop:1109 length:420 start_codon:yes stop_codon:yes gene_type:complete